MKIKTLTEQDILDMATRLCGAIPSFSTDSVDATQKTIPAGQDIQFYSGAIWSVNALLDLLEPVEDRVKLAALVLTAALSRTIIDEKASQ
jgi:hypothetical protein